MTAEREEPGQRNGQKLDDIVQDADEYFNYLKEKHVQQTRLDAIIVSLTVWFGAFVALGVGAYTTIQASALIGYLLAAFLASIAIAVGAGFVTYSEGEAGWSLVRGWTPLDGRDAPGSVCGEEEKAHISLGVWDRRIRNRHHTRIERGSRRIGGRHRISLLQIRGVERV